MLPLLSQGIQYRLKRGGKNWNPARADEDASQKEYWNPPEREVVKSGRSLKGSTGIHVALAFARNPVPPSREAKYWNPPEREVVEAGRSLKGSTGIHVALALARNPVPPSREATKIGILPKRR